MIIPMKTIIVACPDPTLYQEIASCLRQELRKAEQPPLPIQWTSSVEQTKDLLADIREEALLILDANIPKDPNSPGVEKDEDGLTFLDWLTHKDLSIPSIVMLPVLSPDDMNRFSNRIRNVDQCISVLKNPDLISQVVASAMKSLEIETATARHPEVDVEIKIVSHAGQRSYNISGAVSSGDRLVISDTSLQEVADDSPEIVRLEQWERKLANIASKLNRELRSPESNFWGDLSAAIATADPGGEHTKVRFVVDKKYYSALLEAIWFPRTEKYWMLRAPVYRAIAGRGQGAKPLFADEPAAYRSSPINCLLIDGTVEAAEVELDSEVVFLDALTHAASEVSTITEHLTTLKRSYDYNIGTIRVIDPSKYQVEELRKTLDEEKWHIVHFAGHSDYNEHTGKGYIFLQNGSSSIGAIDVEEFSQWLRRTNLVFLGSCKSSEKGFVYELAENQVPAVCGFRWQVPDQPASFFSQNFYSHLFEDKSIEIAFWRSRVDSYRKDKKSVFWAAPMLIQQI